MSQPTENRAHDLFLVIGPDMYWNLFEIWILSFEISIYGPPIFRGLYIKVVSRTLAFSSFD